MTSARRTVRGLVAVLLPLAVVGVACGGDDGGSSGGGGAGALSEEQFCARLTELEESGEELDEAAALEEFSRLAAQAPNDEVRGALLKFGEIAEQLSGMDEDDPESMEEAFGLLFDPEVIAAGETLERFGVDVCGLPPSNE